MKFNIYQYKAMKEKWIREGEELAEVRMRADEKNKQYYGDDKVAKFQRHNGEMVYLMKEEVLKEFVRYIFLMNEAANTVYWWEARGVPEGVTTKEKAMVQFITQVKPEPEYINSILNAFRGSPFSSFANDDEAAKLRAIEDEKRDKVVEFWTL